MLFRPLSLTGFLQNYLSDNFHILSVTILHLLQDHVTKHTNHTCRYINQCLLSYLPLMTALRALWFEVIIIGRCFVSVGHDTVQTFKRNGSWDTHNLCHLASHDKTQRHHMKSVRSHFSVVIFLISTRPFLMISNLDTSQYFTRYDVLDKIASNKPS